MMGLFLVAMLATGGVRAGPAATGQERAQEAGRALIGTLAPKVVLTTIDGDSIDLGSLYGKKAVYLKFWATWCTPCREQMPHFEHAYETAGPNLAVIAVNVGFNDSLEEIQRFRRQHGITMPIVMDDGRLAAAFHLRVTPQHIIIGRDGRIRYVGHLADPALDHALLAAEAITDESQNHEGDPRRSLAATPHINVGDALPSISVKTVAGQTFAFRPKDTPRPTIFVFLSPWCESYLATTRPSMSAACRTTREQLNTLADNHRVRWLGVASGLWATPQEVKDYIAEHDVSIPVTLDESGTLFRQFRVTNVPTIIVADGAGKVVQRIEAGAAGSLIRVIDTL
jgi:peroxiredoxin